MRWSSLSAARLNAIVAVAFAVSACTDTDSSALAPTATGWSPGFYLSLDVSQDSLTEGATKPYVARVVDGRGVPQTVPVSWKSTIPTVATVSDGIVTALTPGRTQLIASAGTLADTAILTIIPKTLVLQVTPQAAALPIGEVISLDAFLVGPNGQRVPVYKPQWKTSDPSTATISPDGSLLARDEGEVLIEALVFGQHATSAVRVFRNAVGSVSVTSSSSQLPIGIELPLQATVRDKDGRVMPDFPVHWTSEDQSIAIVSKEGVVEGQAVGSVAITASAGGKSGSMVIEVLPPAPAAITITLPSDTLSVGATVQAEAEAVDATGSRLAGCTVTWHSSNPAVATVSPSGAITGVSSGTTTITASCDGRSGSVVVTVKPPKVVAVQIEPGAPTVTVGAKAQLTAIVRDDHGNRVGGRPVTWASASNEIATIAPDGIVTGVAVGTVRIEATVDGVKGSVDLQVLNVAVASVNISPSAPSIGVGDTIRLAATARSANGTVLDGRPVTWSSQTPAIATVSDAGTVTGVAAGSGVISASVEGVSQKVTVTVTATAAPIADVKVTLEEPVLTVGEQTDANVTVTDTKGKLVTGVAPTWTSLDTSIAKVASTGRVTARGPGSVGIKATVGKKSGFGTLTVEPPPAATVAQLELFVSSTTLEVGETVQTTVELRDAGGNVLTGQPVSYSTSQPSIATVSASGKITGLAPGTATITASSGSASDPVTVTVEPGSGSGPVIAKIQVSASSNTLAVGDKTQATAVVQDSTGAVIPGVPVTWSSSKPVVATVSNSGLVQAVGAGTATITASAGGVTGSMVVTVGAASPGAVAAVAVTLPVSTLTVGDTTRAIAIAYDSKGTPISGKTATWNISSGMSVAAISSTGLVTAKSAGTATVRATIDGVPGTAALSVQASSPSTPPPPPPPPSGSGVAELPRVLLQTPYKAATGKTIRVQAGDNLQAALDQAQRGDEVVLAAGAVFTGTFTLKAKSGTVASHGWIVVRTEALGQLPPEGTRVTAAQAGLMPKLVTPSTAPALETAPGASGWRLVGLEITVAPSVTAQQYGLVFLGDAQQTALSQVPSDLVLDRVYVHGQSTTNMSRCIALNSARTVITDSYIVECHGRGFDSQAIGGWNGPGPYKIVNNTLQGAGENIMFGGADPRIAGLVPADIEIRRNYLYTPLSWKGVWQKKNLFELKNAVRVLVEENVFDGSWTDAQTGWAVILKSANQSGNCTWCRVTDVTFRRNFFTHAGAGINVAPWGDKANVDTTTRRIAILDNVLDSLGVGQFSGDRRAFQVLQRTVDVQIDGNVVGGGSSLSSFLMLESKTAPTQRLVFTNNTVQHGQYGVLCSGVGPGLPSLNTCASGFTWSGNTIIGSSSSSYPSGTVFTSNEGSAATSLRSALRSVALSIMK